MGVAILFRRTKNSIPFQKALSAIAELDSEKFTLSSGYFAERLEVVDTLLPKIKQGFNDQIYHEFHFIGGMFQENNTNQDESNKEKTKKPKRSSNFENFEKIARRFRDAGINILIKKSRSMSYHAKLALKLKITYR